MPRVTKRDPANRRPRGVARAALIEAASGEFDEHGYDGTDSNRIARRAGYAPQTFYWHFKDKAAVFAEVLNCFVAEEYAAIEAAMAAGAEAVAQAIIRLHTDRQMFRRSLRHLSVSDPHIRSTRRDIRLRQVANLIRALPGMPPAEAVVLLLATDRLADAAAEGELTELGVDNPAALLLELWQKFGATLEAADAISQERVVVE